jgi:flagellar hook-basal body complex protein FliE
MQVQLRPFNFAEAVARAGLTPTGQPIGSTVAPKTEVKAPSFGDAMTQALKSVSTQQQEASRLQREVQLDNPTVSLEETMVAMQKAQIGFQAALQVRNRLVSAYSEIMNMQV